MYKHGCEAPMYQCAQCIHTLFIILTESSLIWDLLPWLPKCDIHTVMCKSMHYTRMHHCHVLHVQYHNAHCTWHITDVLLLITYTNYIYIFIFALYYIYTHTHTHIIIYIILYIYICTTLEIYRKSEAKLYMSAVCCSW